MPETFQYRIIKSSWGIAIDIRVRVVSGRVSESAVLVAPGIWMVIEAKFYSAEDRLALLRGLRLVKDEIGLAIKDGAGEVSVVIEELWYNPMDFQQEGVTVAVVQCVARELGFRAPVIDVEFEGSLRRYIFSGLEVTG